jgi:two-component system, cell cycle response regulator
VAEAHNGQAALDIARTEQPQLVLLDINLLDISGYEVCSRLKSDVRTSNIPAVLHTATEATGMARNRAELLGAAAFLTYPVQTEHLLTVIEEAAIRNTPKS